MDPIRQLFLDHVQLVVAKEANRETLHELLRLATPKLTESAVLTEASRTTAFKRLQLRIHPDKHPGWDTTKIFHDVKAFYDICCENICRVPKRKANPNLPFSADCEFPRDFHVQDKWPFLDVQELKPEGANVCERDLSALIAALCMNAHGAIAHGQKTELNYSIGQLKKYDGVQATFDGIGGTKGVTKGGTKQLTSIEEIKKELMENGPVVSNSFILSQDFLEYSQSLLHSRIGKKHELLIVSWKLTEFGQVWLAKSLKNGNDEQPVHIAFKQFGVDDICLAPTNWIENIPWQSGPYFDRNITSKSDVWMSWSTMFMCMDSTKLEALARCFSTGLHAAIEQRSPLVIRHKNKVTRSRQYHLTEVEWNKEKACWKVDVSRVS